MTRIRPVLFTCLVAVLIFAGCAGKSAEVFVPSDLNGSIRTGHLVQKADHFLVILDCSGSMAELYDGEKKFVLAREAVRNMIAGIPETEMNFEAGLRVFGLTMNPFVESTSSLVDMGPLDKAAYDKALDKVTFATGKSNLALAIAQSSDDLDRTTGEISLIIVTDGKETDGEAARALEVVKNTYRDRLCVYTIQVGHDPNGQKLLERLSRKGQCGYSENLDNVNSPKAMACFIARGLLKKGPDQDEDGTPDRIDLCPNTPAGASVDDTGCWQLTGLEFKTNKADIAKEYYPIMDKAICVLKKTPGINVLIGGHTDSRGPDKFNQELSQDRAQAVMDYMVKKGVAPERLSVQGFGAAKPIAPNDSQEGRAKNRRVTLTPIAVQDAESADRQ
ncbi:OmpA-OmpF porin, OOP family [Desulfatibacillum alkenivorans DSM 16219]|uniref:OmpA-OmpF porin, OOP family n=1 Tax=Desulfatibacillum alkenivorans DSM 16219 TaxID=1121393 RepID=A0A1M6JBN2_9BACT|nr:OmpA family protein [Desulfatibacillum alkenivorans]SHJ44070.1 OmpA-OmpF porin, OOP family [Desulfatibacillum alkenivorans DSM 16219]